MAIFFYIFGSWFTSNFIFQFIICIILLAFDFWTVKNISGRLLVGLRWWSYVKDNGANEWIFESLEDTGELSPTDANVFWGALYVTPLIWLLLLVVGILRLNFEYLPIVIAAMSMSAANIIGYLKCSDSAKNKLKKLAERNGQNPGMSEAYGSSIRNWVISSLLTLSSNNSNTLNKMTAAV